MTEKILLVDDDPNVLAGINRQLRKQFHLETGLGGEQGLEAVDSQGPFAVIVADMRMPGMDGIQFLTQVKERAPDSVRMMLTGNADLQTAIEAVNEGNVFRFLVKPCPPETLANALRAGIEQYRLIIAEQELLGKTLSGSVKMLTELLSLVNPAAFGQSLRIRRYVKDIAVQLQLPDLWQFKLAAMLSQIGCITLPSKICSRVSAGLSLSYNEQKAFSSHPSVGYKLLVSIPRLESIAGMIEGQLRPFEAYTPSKNLTQEDTIALGSQILKVVLDFEHLLTRGISHESALFKLRGLPNMYNPKVVAAFAKVQMDEADKEKSVKEVKVKDLELGMVTDEDIQGKNGRVFVRRGQEITYAIMVNLRNLSQEAGIVEPFRVRVAHIS